MRTARCSFHMALHRPPGLLPCPGERARQDRRTTASLFQMTSMVCVSTQHRCCATSRWDPGPPVDPSEPSSWMLNNDPQRESDLFFPVNNPFHSLESLVCRNTWAGLRFWRGGSLASVQSFCLPRLTTFGVVMWQSLSAHEVILCFPTHVSHTGSPGSSDLFRGKGTVMRKSKGETYLE